MQTLQMLFEWPNWEGIMHIILCGLILYTSSLLITKSSSRTVTNLLLLSVAVGIDTMIHQNINRGNNTITGYF